MCSDRSDQLRGQRQKTPLRSHRSSACRCASPRAEPRINGEQMHSPATGHDLPPMRTLSRQAHWQMSDPKARNGRHGGSPDGRRRLVMVEKSAPSCGSGCQQGMVVGFGVECLAACVATPTRSWACGGGPRFHFVASRLRLPQRALGHPSAEWTVHTIQLDAGRRIHNGLGARNAAKVDLQS